jgi:Fur family ferric uptake transcriptional regulator
MTTAPKAQPRPVGGLPEAEVVLRAQGIRLTSPRRLVLQALFATQTPVSAEQLADGLRLDQASVYRTLEMLERHGLIRHTHLGHGPGLYVLVGRGERGYAYCEQCGGVSALAPGQLEAAREEIRRLCGYEVSFTHFPIVGVCPSCAKAALTG